MGLTVWILLYIATIFGNSKRKKPTAMVKLALFNHFPEMTVYLFQKWKECDNQRIKTRQ